MATHAEIRAAALAVAAESPDAGHWPAGYGASPTARWVPILRAAGWPCRAERVDVTYADLRRGYAVTRVVEVEVTVFPETWLKLLCDRIGYDYARVVRRLVGPGPGE